MALGMGEGLDMLHRLDVIGAEAAPNVLWPEGMSTWERIAVNEAVTIELRDEPDAVVAAMTYEPAIEWENVPGRSLTPAHVTVSARLPARLERVFISVVIR